MAKRTPWPGRRVRGSTTGRPIMALLDLLGQRWTLRIMWELRDGAVLNFRKLQEQCDDLSPAVQNDRLSKLREARIVEHAADEGYRLTPQGVRLARVLNQLNAWADNWAKRIRQE
jgi:DNA-binding HxlR family transcriptional regulator